MEKQYIKTQIAMRQTEFPIHLKMRECQLPINVDKIITIPGVRRCGKTSRMEAVVNELLNSGVSRERILWVSFDDERFVNMIPDEFDLIIEAYREMYPHIDMQSVYIFFDEIQLINNWEYFVMRLFKHYSKHIYISGSNATMLSSELKSALRGWPDEQETLPLSFKEYCVFNEINTESWLEADMAKLRNAFAAFNNEGGFPEVVLTNNPLQKTKVLQTYFDTMLLKDLVEHYKLKNIEALRYFLKRVMANLTKPTSIRAIFGDIKSQNLKVGKNDLYEWAGYACNIFLFIRVPNFNKSLKKIESSLPKYYCIDNGLYSSVLLPQSDDDGKKLENTVFLHLYRHKTPIQQIFYYQGKAECDFLIQSGVSIEQLIQVTWRMDNEETRKREIRGLVEAAELTGCKNLCIITADTQEVIILDNGLEIKVIPAWRWLLGR